VSTLKARAAEVGIRIYEERFASLATLLNDGVLVLVIARETTHPLSAGFVQRQIMSDPLLIACATRFRPRKRRTLQWSDLQDWPWLVPPRGSTTFMHLESLLFRNGLTFPRGSIELNSRGGAIARLLLAHPFLALVPLSYARPYLETSMLVEAAHAEVAKDGTD